jgi:hypothetical protein
VRRGRRLQDLPHRPVRPRETRPHRGEPSATSTRRCRR